MGKEKKNEKRGPEEHLQYSQIEVAASNPFLERGEKKRGEN